KVTVERGKIRIGLTAIKGIGYQSVKEIVRARKEKKYTDLFDFYLRTSSRIIKRNIIEMLIRSGAFDDIYSNRASLLASIEDRKSTRLNSSHVSISYAVFCLKKKQTLTSCHI